MRIFHTADWHLGKLINGFSMLEDQKYILDRLFDSLKFNNIDVLIISGDIYDRSIPPQEAIKLLDDIIYKIISELNIKILIIPGNHDGAQRLCFANKLYKDNGLYITGSLDKKIPKILLKDEYGDLNFYLLPYFDPAQVSKIFENNNLKNNIKTFNDAFSAIINYNKKFIDLNSRNILVAHGFFGALNKNNIFYDQILSPAEVSVGGADIIDISVASFFDYIALGHLHSPQKIKNQNFRYSGSLLKYSVDEASQQKSCVVIDFKQKNNLDLSFETLEPLRDLRVVRGYLKDLCESEESTKLISNDYVFVELLDRDSVFDAVPRLRQTFKNIIGVKMINRFTNDNNIIINKNKIQDKNFYSLFKDFYFDVSGYDLNSKKQKIISEIFLNINKY
ncbi:MAG: exonuclease SbcCD subunit D [Oscillospiraceae bacterium]|nr:exonuclease SbcCD subunit D [Oscillospiraceae bacterium]